MPTISSDRAGGNSEFNEASNYVFVAQCCGADIVCG